MQAPECCRSQQAPSGSPGSPGPQEQCRHPTPGGVLQARYTQRVLQAFVSPMSRPAKSCVEAGSTECKWLCQTNLSSLPSNVGCVLHIGQAAAQSAPASCKTAHLPLGLVKDGVHSLHTGHAAVHSEGQLPVHLVGQVGLGQAPAAAVQGSVAAHFGGVSVWPALELELVCEWNVACRLGGHTAELAVVLESCGQI